MNVKGTALRYVFGALAAFAISALLLEGPATTQFQKNDDELIAHRFDGKPRTTVLTEEKVRAIVKEEVQPMLTRQLEEIRTIPPSKKAKSEPEKSQSHAQHAPSPH